MKKKLWIIAAVVLAIPLLLLAVAAVFINPIVRSGIEKGASAALRVPVRLASASVGWAGRASLRQLEVDNPQGFAAGHSLTVQRIDASARIPALLGDVVRIEEVTIVRPEVAVEFAGTRNNLSTLLGNASGGRGEGSGKKFLIRRLRLVEGSARFRSDLLGGGEQRVTLPTLELENVGTAEGGASTGEILTKVLETLASAALTAGEGRLPGSLLENLRGSIRNLPGRTKEELRRRLDPSEIEKRLREHLERKTAD